MKTKLWHFINKKYIAFVAVSVLAIIATVFIIRQKKNSDIEMIQIRRGDLVQEVVTTGNIKPVDTVDLAFEKTGKISFVGARAGDTVRPGDLLVALEAGEFHADLLQAEAQLEKEEAKLAQLRRGTRSEEINIQAVKVANSRIALEDAKRNLIDKIQDSYTKADDAVRNKVDQFISNPRSANPQLNIQNSGYSTLENELEVRRIAVENVLVAWKGKLDLLNEDSNLISATAEAKANLTDIKLFLDNISLYINSVTSSSALSQATLDTYKADVATARTNVNSATNAISVAEEKWRNAKASVTLAENELALKEAGATTEEIAAQAAAVKEAAARVRSIQAQLAKMSIRSPLSGIVTKQDAAIGEIVAANTSLVSVISASKVEIESHIPEIDIGKINVGNPVVISVDAFPQEAFSGSVVFIDPAETTVDGVVNFKIKISVEKNDPRLKSGLTTNLAIETSRKSGVLVAPQYAVLEKDGKKLVRIKNNGDIQEIPVITGMRGKDGLVEISSGLKEGDVILGGGIQ